MKKEREGNNMWQVNRCTERQLTYEKCGSLAARQSGLMFLTCIDDGLKLQCRQVAIVNHFFRNQQSVGDMWDLDTGQGWSLDYWVWMLAAESHCHITAQKTTLVTVSHALLMIVVMIQTFMNTQWWFIQYSRKLHTTLYSTDTCMTSNQTLKASVMSFHCHDPLSSGSNTASSSTGNVGMIYT